MRTLNIAAGVAILLATVAADARIRTEAREYKDGNTVLEGVLAYDDAQSGRRPGIVVVHDWSGLGPDVKGRIEMLAKLGYVAFAADIYGKGVVPKNAGESAKLAGEFKADRPMLRRRAQAALDVLLADPHVDPKRVAAMGYCFGGGTALELARSGAPLRAVVSFHGFLDTPDPADAKAIRAKVLVLHGADDPFVPPAQVAAFEDEMRKAAVDWQLVKYGGAVHAFTIQGAGSDPSKGVAYNPEADRRSWEEMKTFLAATLK
jgi:dienelactone hydrolase